MLSSGCSSCSTVSAGDPSSLTKARSDFLRSEGRRERLLFTNLFFTIDVFARDFFLAFLFGNGDSLPWLGVSSSGTLSGDRVLLLLGGAETWINRCRQEKFQLTLN